LAALQHSVFATRTLSKTTAYNYYRCHQCHITKREPWLFRCRPDDSIALWPWEIHQGRHQFTKIGLLHDADAFGTVAPTRWKKAKELGLTVVRREKTATAPRTLPLSSCHEEAGVRSCLLRHRSTALLQRQLRQLGSPFKFLGSPAGIERQLNLAKEAAEGFGP